MKRSRMSILFLYFFFFLLEPGWNLILLWFRSLYILELNAWQTYSSSRSYIVYMHTAQTEWEISANKRRSCNKKKNQLSHILFAKRRRRRGRRNRINIQCICSLYFIIWHANYFAKFYLLYIPYIRLHDFQNPIPP